MLRLRGSYQIKSFKGCLPQILLGPFLISLTHLLRQDIENDKI